ncbi:MAG: trypsin-like peptidase domain-containing protein [Pyrinomonadaceae bacterium]|nr:trypsin-like peptidase domain-containing protein [Pyrinomonadaceae bacterium]
MDLDRELVEALNAYDRERAAAICEDLADEFATGGKGVSVNRARRLLAVLRRKRRFGLLMSLADTFFNSGFSDTPLKIKYVQALIDSGHLAAGNAVLETLAADSSLSLPEMLEVKGLMGRVDKQRFVEMSGADNPGKEKFLAAAVESYLAGRELRNDSYWHSINAVALQARAKREGISLPHEFDFNVIAREVLDILAKLSAESMEGPKPWESATQVEANIALEDYPAAKDAAAEYAANPDADAFEIGSTLRQLVEIWQLTDNEEPGSDILPLLRAALLEREGGAINLTHKEANDERVNLEGIYGDNPPKTVGWYKQGLARFDSIARIELPDGRGIGTAGIVNGSDFIPGHQGLLLLTNSHVVSNNPADSGLPPARVRANFQGKGEVFEIETVVWSSPQRQLDASFLSIKEEPALEPLPIAESGVEMGEPAPRVYVIGHPSGRDLEISLNDNRIVGTNDTFLHYRAATEPGSSGSPVFDQHAWEMIALHHGGSDRLPRIDNQPGTYQANEGISISAIKNAVRETAENAVSA